MTDIIDQIDALIDEQLAAGEPETGYSFGDPQYPDCPHCYRGWHGLRITERIEAMHRIGQFDPNYRVADDDTPVLCEGSEFIGPRRPTPREKLAAALSTSSTDYQIDYQIIIGWSGLVSDPQPVAPPCLKPPPTIEFGPRTWWHYELVKHRQIARQPTGYTTYTPPRHGAPWLRFWSFVDPLAAAIQVLWPQFTAPDFPVPPSPGYDFSHYANERQPFWTRPLQ